MGVHDTFPVDAENKSRHHHALGVLGLKFMRLSSDSAGPVEIRGLFDTLQKEEVDDSLQLFASIKAEDGTEKKFNDACYESPPHRYRDVIPCS
jgi:hypothetical protein